MKDSSIDWEDEKTDETQKKKLKVPSIRSIENWYKSVHLAWAPVSGAVRYRVMRREGSGSWKKVADTSELKFTDQTVISGKVYTYTVKAIAGYGYTDSGNAPAKKIAFVKTPAGITLKRTGKGVIRLSWIPDNKADGYQILYSRDKEMKAGVKRITINSKTVSSRIIKGLQNGTRYYVQIRSFRKDSSKCWYSKKTQKNIIA